MGLMSRGRPHHIPRGGILRLLAVTDKLLPGDGAERACWPAVAHRREHGRGQAVLRPVHPGKPALAVAGRGHCSIGIGDTQRLARVVVGSGRGVGGAQQGGRAVRDLAARRS